MRQVWGYAIFIVLGAGTPALAGELRDFEQEATEEDGHEPRERHRSEPVRQRDYEHAHEAAPVPADHGPSFSAVVAGAFLNAWLGRGEHEEEGSPEPATPTFTMTGHPFPRVRLDTSYQWVASRAHAIDLRAQLGKQLAAFDSRWTHYWEKDTDGTLDLLQFRGLLRFPLSSHFMVDAGLGLGILRGTTTSYGISPTLPVTIRPFDFLSLELRPSWILGRLHLGDYQADIGWIWKWVSLHAGYRWVVSGSQSLHGPCMGLSAAW